jgi:Protein of unknown function (DUF3800)
VDFFFADDSSQRRPTRAGMGPLVAVGGVHVRDENVRDLELQIDAICAEYGFPVGQEFKWSPGEELWMRTNLVQQRRTDFFAAVLAAAREAGASAMVIIEDKDRRTAGEATTHEEDVVNLFLERVNLHLGGVARQGIVIVDRPSGGRAAEDRFLARCLDTLQTERGYVRHDRIALNVLATHSASVRLLQLADLVTGCTLAYIAGESRWSPPVFEQIKPTLREEMGRIGGVGVKIHPDFRYGNLYHWLLGDDYLVRGMSGFGLPLRGRPYFESALAA